MGDTQCRGPILVGKKDKMGDMKCCDSIFSREGENYENYS